MSLEEFFRLLNMDIIHNDLILYYCFRKTIYTGFTNFLESPFFQLTNSS